MRCFALHSLVVLVSFADGYLIYTQYFDFFFEGHQMLNAYVSDAFVDSSDTIIRKIFRSTNIHDCVLKAILKYFLFISICIDVPRIN